MKVYTLKSCDTCKKALKWLNEQAIDYDNHDIRADGLERAVVQSIVASLGWETALNRRSTTWRSLSEAQKADIDDAKAVDLIHQNSTLMKRPVIVTKDSTLCGFDPKVQSQFA